MNWFFLSVICLLSWGFADMYYKKGTDETDRYSHMKTAVWVGLVMGICSVFMMPFSESKMNFAKICSNSIKYLPASLSYIISMVIGYAGLRYLEISIISPVQNASGALSAIVILIYYAVTGRISNVGDELSKLDILGSLFVVFGVIFLSSLENKLSKQEIIQSKGNNKYRFGALALIFPILYCVFDTIGTSADAVILDGESGMSLGEIDVLILYGLTFFAAGLVSWFYIWFKEKRVYNIFKKSEHSKALAALCEEFGQVFYVYAMAEKPVLAAPVIGSYCIVSVVLSRLFLKEKLKPMQYVCVSLVVIGIIILAISEGISEM